MPPMNQPTSRSESLSVGSARRALELNESNLLNRPEVQGVGVGLRDDRAAFIVTVSDLDARDRFRQNFERTSVGGMPVHVDISSICQTSGLAHGRDFDGALLPQVSMWARLTRFVRGLGTIFSP